MIHYFNPGHETAVSNSSPYYMAPANVAVMQKELAFLPAWYADRGDVVLTVDEIDRNFLLHLSENLLFGVKGITLNDLNCYPDHYVRLWGVSPQAIHYFEELNLIYNLQLQLPVWNEELIYLTGRQSGNESLGILCDSIKIFSDFAIPRLFYSVEDIELAVEKSSFQLLAKAPYSSSGRGLLWLPMDGLTRTERQILHGMIKKQGAVSVEKVLDKQIDFAMEFDSDREGNIHFMGYSFFYTNNKGAYLGNYIGSQTHIEEIITAKISLSLLNEVKDHLIEILSKKYAPYYTGCIGVDMLIYKEENVYKLHPCVEINLRSNMGLLALHISENYIDSKSQGQFRLDFSAKEGEIFHRHNEMMKTHPALFYGGRIVSGYLPLCPVHATSHYWAYILVS